MNKFILCLSFLITIGAMEVHAQKIEEAEYFIDIDPGFGLATKYNLAASDSIVLLTEQ